MNEQMPEYPSWDEMPTTLDVIQDVIQAHPDYQITTYRSEKGNRFVMLEYPESGEFEDGATDEFIEMVRDLGDSHE